MIFSLKLGNLRCDKNLILFIMKRSLHTGLILGILVLSIILLIINPKGISTQTNILQV